MVNLEKLIFGLFESGRITQDLQYRKADMEMYSPQKDYQFFFYQT